MSMHPSLKSASKVKTRRNVLKRFERVEVLKVAGKWKEGPAVAVCPRPSRPFEPFTGERKALGSKGTKGFCLRARGAVTGKR